MCLIVDANVANDVFSGDPSADFVPIFDALHSGVASAFYGGELAREYTKLSAESVRLIRTLDQAGRMKKMSDQLVDVETTAVKRQGLCRSNDHHVIALARISGARLLCSKDQPLHDDFKNPEIVNNPRGSIYQNQSHRHLINQHCKGHSRRPT